MQLISNEIGHACNYNINIVYFLDYMVLCATEHATNHIYGLV
jgi:hypothetical protein